MLSTSSVTTRKTATRSSNDTPGVDGWGAKDQEAWRFAATLDLTKACGP
jgi:hypothetical protein